MPPIPDDFSDRVRRALEQPDPTKWRQLQSLAALELDFPRTLQLDKALNKAAVAAPPWPHCRIAVLSACTVDHLLPAMRVAGAARGLWIEAMRGEYGLYRQEILEPSPAIRAFEPEYVLLSVSARQLLGSIPVSAGAAEVEAAISEELGQLRSLWHRAREAFGCAVIQQSYLDVSTPLFGNFDRQAPASPTRIIHELNHALLRNCADEGVLLLDVAAASARDGLGLWFDVNRWLQGKYEIAPTAAARYGQLVAQVLCAQKGLAKKCLVLDLDNTLWGGVIGDDGVDGIVLGEGSARGEAHLHLQRYARQMKDRGVILAVCSKNDPAIAETAFRSHPEMLLRMEDIAAFVANWDDKAQNLVRIAKQLNIGLDSLVFVDDNPVERARIRESLPEVTVPELPEDPAGYVDAIARGGWFDATSFTSEDAERANQYAANAQRQALEESAQSMEAFLQGLAMTMPFGRVSAAELPRAVQLLNKTNQFNTTGRRYTQEEVDAYRSDPQAEALWFRLQDRFGDNGLVSVVLARIAADERTLHLDNWVMSCRVFGRQLEHEIMNVLVEIARTRGLEAVEARYQPTAKNGVIADLFAKLGFERVGSDPDGAARWRAGLDAYRPHATQISRGAPN